MIKIGIIADKDAYPSKTTQDVFMKIYQQFGQTTQIYTIGRYPVELQFKKLALEKNCTYGEFNLASTARNVFSILDENYFGKRPHPTHEPDAYIKLFRYVDRIIVFVAGNLKPDKFIKMGEKTKKKTLIINI